MRKLLATAVLLLAINIVNAQVLQNANWCFGSNARLDFNTIPPSVSSCAITPNLPITGTDVASVSNDLGQLQFYTNGRTVWNAANTQIGTGLYGYNHRGVMHQYLAIVPKPGSSSLYYLFTGSSALGNLFYPPAPERLGIFYSVVDMSANGGAGAIVSGQMNIPLKNHNGELFQYDGNTIDGLKPEYIKVTTTLNQAGDGVWVVYYVMFEEAGLMKRYAYSYLVTENGINATVDGTSPLPTQPTLLDNHNYPDLAEWAGPIKISPDGNYLCDASFDVVNLYQFNDQTGAVTFDRNIYSNAFPENAGFGLEFSPNSQYIYFTTYDGTIYQSGKGGGEEPADLSLVKLYQHTISLNESKVVGRFTVDNTLFPVSHTKAFGLQRAIDNKIYVCVSTQAQANGWLGAIRQPNLFYTACDFVPGEIQLLSPNIHYGHLPQWVHKVRRIWPKVYSGKAPMYLGKDNNDNILMSIHEANLTQQPINHQGAFPSVTNNMLGVTFHYSPLGITNWYKINLFANSMLQSGITQMDNTYGGGGSNMSYYNSNNGVITSGPTFIPNNNEIICETNSGGFICSDNTDLQIYFDQFTSGTIYNLGFSKVIYNPSTNYLYIYKRGYSVDRFCVYNLSGNNLTLIVDQTFATDQLGYLTQVDNLGNVYMVRNQQLQKYDYLANTFSLVTIPGFSNTNIAPLYPSNVYTQNEFLIGHGLEQRIYFMNLVASQKKYIPTTNFLTSTTWHLINTMYFIQGQDLYVAGPASGNMTIGSQAINTINNTNVVFLTKFNLQNDFSSRMSQQQIVENNKTVKNIDIQITPNPAVDQARINVINSNSMDYYSRINETVMIRIIDGINNVYYINRQYSLRSNINISNLKPGVYYVELTTKNGEQIGKTFIKL